MSEGPEVGSVHEEAVRLLGALGEWAQQHDPPEQDVPGSERDDVALHGDCRVCPVCQLIHAVRQTRPEVRDHLVSAASSLLQAAAELLATRPEAAGTVGADGSSGAPVERIDLDADPPPAPS